VTGPRRSRRGTAALLAVTGIAAPGIALAGCGGAGQAATAHDHSAPASVSSVQGRYDGLNLATPYHRPSFTLTDTGGASYDFTTATKGHPTLLFFGYTHCPDVCPTTMADISVALRSVGPEIAQRVRVVFVTTDPKRDTPAVLGQWLGNFDADLGTKFVGLTGDQPTLDQAQLSAGVPLAQDDGQQHSALLLLYGADDKAHVAFDAGNTPQDIAHDLKLVAASS
jgi:protein SCO1/2